MTKKRELKEKKIFTKNNANNDTLSLSVDLKSDNTIIQNSVIQQNIDCLKYLNPINFTNEIERCINPLKSRLSKCQPCECFKFQENSIKSEIELLNVARDDYDCSSEASSAFVSIIELDGNECKNMVEAVEINQYRKPNILTLPFKDEYLTVKSIKKKLSSKESDTAYSSAMRPKEDIDNRFARPAWITGLHDSVGLGAFEWEKLMKSILGQGRYGRNSSREPFFRFALPTNLELLQDLSPLIYLEKYCNISDRRMALYQKEFLKNREHKSTHITESNLFKALNSIMVGTLSKEQFTYIYEILELNKDIKVEMKTFVGICALTERLFFSKNLTSSSEESYEIQKGYIEMVDFMNINYKLQNLIIQSNVDKLIRAI